MNLWTDHLPLTQAMHKELRRMTPKMHNFKETIQGFIMNSSFVKPVYAVFRVKHSGHFLLHLERVEDGG